MALTRKLVYLRAMIEVVDKITMLTTEENFIGIPFDYTYNNRFDDIYELDIQFSTLYSKVTELLTPEENEMPILDVIDLYR